MNAAIQNAAEPALNQAINGMPEYNPLEAEGDEVEPELLEPTATQ